MRAVALLLVLGSLCAAVPHLDSHVVVPRRYDAHGRDLSAFRASLNARRRHHARAIARRNESEDCDDSRETTVRSNKVQATSDGDDEDCEEEEDSGTTTRQHSTSTSNDDEDCEEEDAGDSSTADASSEDDCEDDGSDETPSSSTSSSQAAQSTQAKAKAQVKVKAQSSSSGSNDSKGQSSGSSSASSSSSSTKSSGSSSGSSSSGSSVVGTATFFTQDGTVGACGLDNNKVQSDSTPLVAMCPSEFKGKCGQTLTITDTTTGKSVQAFVNDECPSCDCSHLDLSLGAYDALGQSRDVGVLNIKFSF